MVTVDNYFLLPKHKIYDFFGLFLSEQQVLDERNQWRLPFALLTSTSKFRNTKGVESAPYQLQYARKLTGT